MKRLILAACAAALLVLTAAAVPVFAQDPPGTGETTVGPWSGSQFDEADLRAGNATRDTKTVTITGVFTYTPEGDWDERTILQNVTVTVTDPAVDGCEPPSVVGEPTEGGENRARTFSFQVSSQCNVTTQVTVQAKTTSPGLNNQRSRQITSSLRFDAPPEPVTDIIASVEDVETKDVNISWTLPEGAEPETTYSVERAGPDAGDEPEWTTIAPAEPEEPTEEPTEEPPVGEEPAEPDPVESPITDTVEDEGVYLYRVVAERPSATPEGEPHVVPGTVDDVRVGEPPPTTTTTTTSPPVTQPGSATTVSIPRLNTTPTRDRLSTSRDLTPVQPSAPTTIDTGFEETLDYGDQEPGELAAEGQSVINSEDDGVVGPGAAAAAALVLVGWAGHIFYFRRLAAQF